MGLDSVEFVLSIEEEFGITISDADAERLVTPRKVADHVAFCLGETARDGNRCLSQTQFYRLRSTLTRQFGASRRAIRPGTPIRQLLPGDIRTQWRRLRTAIGTRHFPGLKCAKSVNCVLLLLLPLSVASVHQAGLPFWSATISGFVLWALIFHASATRLADRIPPAFATVGALVPYVSLPDRTEWSREYILQRVIQMASEQFAIPVEHIRPDSLFVEDLGID